MIILFVIMARMVFPKNLHFLLWNTLYLLLSTFFYFELKKKVAHNNPVDLMTLC